ncbi:hypothetical protein J1N35_032271 [Gossypium stocksii]|uniref:Mitochondrial glycoprotein n=1 Tax=Gossypium stocksii TaxID=47602 RepID=A0A9D3ZWJ3_9ROSI|nr:hypothetical protein J1N35_032271 [Gossypium stocksii]
MTPTHISKQASKQAAVYATQKETYKFMLSRLGLLNPVRVFLHSLFPLNSLAEICRLTVFPTSRSATYKARFHNFKVLVSFLAFFWVLVKIKTARFIRTAQRAFVSAASKTLTNGSQSRIASASSLLQFNPYATSQTYKSPFTANIIRILSNEIEYQHDCAPPIQPATSFNSFTVQDRPGEKWMTMRGKYGEYEEIKIEPGEDSTGENVVLHISLLVDISKGQGYPDILCSAWPDHLEIQKVYLLNRDKTIINPYMGRDLRRKKNRKLQRTLSDYLEERGVNNELCVFLHEYVMNKDRIELIQWLGNVKSIVQK